MKKNVTLICDLQFGSTGKGLIAGYLAERDQPDVIVTAWSPNAGHTYINSKGEEFIHTMLANGIVSPRLRHILIGPGSVVNLQSLFDEIKAARAKGYMQDVQVLIHPHAPIVTQRHRDIEEAMMTGIGSTKKGSGAALIEKIQRQPDTVTVARDFAAQEFSDGFGPCCWSIDDVEIRIAGFEQYNQIIDRADHIHVEGAQGFSLGINNGFYPYTTSRECTPAQIMTDCNIPMAKLNKVVGTMRTFPIRVANRYDEEGNQIGWSGPFYKDQQELTWDQLGVEPEKTTVTKLVRRVFTFSKEQTRQAIRMCQPDEIFLNFCNYFEDPLQAMWMMDDIQKIHIEETGRNPASFEYGPAVRYVGEGPTKDSVYDVGALKDLMKWKNDKDAAAKGHIPTTEVE